MAHFDQRLLDHVSYGTSYGTGYKTDIKTLNSGVERRNGLWQIPRGQFAIIYRMLNEEHYDQVFAAFHACCGRLHTFRLKDRTDYMVNGEFLGIGSGLPTEYQLSRSISFYGVTKRLPVFLPVVDTITIYDDGVPISAQVNPNGTVIVNAAPGGTVTWSGEFDKKVRFDQDNLDWTLEPRAGGIHILLSSDVYLQEVLE